MRKLAFLAVPLLVLSSSLSTPSASADVAVAIPKAYAYPTTNNFLSAFARNPFTDEFITAGYGSNQSVFWSHVLDDTSTPWGLEGDIRLNWFQLNLFARNGFLSNVGSYAVWGMNYSPLNDKYIFLGIGILKGPVAAGTNRLDTEPDILIYDPRLPDSLQTVPSGVTLSNEGGVYSLVDSTTVGGEPRAKFITSGVQAGDRITLYPVDTYATVTSTVYTITQVVSETELRLDRDPIWEGLTTATDVGYILSLQPWVSLYSFRAAYPLFAENLTVGPKPNYTGGLSPDGTTLYVSEIVANNIIAVDTQTPESFTTFVSAETFKSYVEAVNASGRHLSVYAVVPYADSIGTGWTNQSTGASVTTNDTAFATEGTKSLSAAYTAADGKVDLRFTTDPNTPPWATADFEKIRFYVNGGTTGGQTFEFYAYDPNGNTSPAIPITAQPNTWATYEIPATSLGLDSVSGLVWANTAGAAQDRFYLDFVSLRYIDPPPPGVGEFDPNSAGGSAAQVATDSAGRVWFTEGETDDLIWTTDGTTLHTFLTSNEIQAATQGNIGSSASTGTQFLGMTIDQAGTIYWSDNITKGVWKAPACGGSENIRLVASAADIRAGLGLSGTTSAAGLNGFTIRDHKILTFTFTSGAVCIFSVDMNTFDYGDFSGDIDTDAEDFALFAQALAGPDVDTAPPGCTTELFEQADLTKAADVDLADYAKLQCFATGAL